MGETTVKKAASMLAGDMEMSPLQYFKYCKDDPNFIKFLQAIFGRIKDVEEGTRDKFVNKLGQELGYAILDIHDQAFLAVDKRRLEGPTWSETDEEFLEAMEVLMKSLR